MEEVNASEVIVQDADVHGEQERKATEENSETENCTTESKEPELQEEKLEQDVETGDGQSEEVGKEEKQFSKVEHMPLAVLSIVMTWGAVALVWKKAHVVLDFEEVFGHIFITIAAVIFVFISTVYVIKTIRYPRSVLMEWNHPIKSNFFPAIPICILLFSIYMSDEWEGFAKVMFSFGAFIQLFLSLVIVGRWFENGVDVAFCNPTCLIPPVANLLVPVAAGKFSYNNTAWLFYSSGILFWIALFVSVFQKIVQKGLPPPKLIPSLAILIAPPAIAQVAYTSLTHRMDYYAQNLTYLAVFTLLLILRLSGTFYKSMKQTGPQITWWAMGFPSATVTISFLEYHSMITKTTAGTSFSKEMSYLFIFMCTGVLVSLSAITVRCLLKGKFIQKE